jgi:hypothetical protein
MNKIEKHLTKLAATLLIATVALMGLAALAHATTTQPTGPNCLVGDPGSKSCPPPPLTAAEPRLADADPPSCALGVRAEPEPCPPLQVAHTASTAEPSGGPSCFGDPSGSGSCPPPPQAAEADGPPVCVMARGEPEPCPPHPLGTDADGPPECLIGYRDEPEPCPPGWRVGR